MYKRQGIACPHFDEEKEREPYVNDVIQREIIESCIVLRAIVPCILKMILTISQLILVMVETALELQVKIIL